MWYSFWMTNRWLLLNFDALGAVGVFITMLMSIATMSNGAGMAGLCITSAMAFTSSGKSEAQISCIRAETHLNASQSTGLVVSGLVRANLMFAIFTY